MSFINVLKKIVETVETGCSKYTDTMDKAEQKTMKVVFKSDIMIDDHIEQGHS